MFEKPVEYWLAFIGAAIYVGLQKSESDAWLRRLLKLVSSAAITLGLSASFAERVGISEAWAVVILMVLGQLGLDLMTALISDRKFIKDLIKSRLGGDQTNG